MIEVQGLSKIFGDPKSAKSVRAVDDVTFEIKAGEVFAFLGPNGAGKTTTIQMLTTLLKPTSGIVRIDGLDPAWVTVLRYSDYAWRDVPDAWLQRDYLPRFKPG